MKTGQVNIVVALMAEAKPLIAALSLKKIIELHEFDVFVNTDSSIHLIISGIGKIKAAAATGFLHVLTRRQAFTVYLNFGIAGSGCHELGELVIAHKIIDQATNSTYYPSLHAEILLSRKKRRLSTGALMTVDKPMQVYQDHELMDMEASGFFAIANQLVSLEQVQVIKLVSDNEQQSYHSVNATQVNTLITAKLTNLLWMINFYLAFSTAEANVSADYSTEFNLFLQKWHFTHYQIHQLRELLRRWTVVFAKSQVSAFSAVVDGHHAKQILQRLTDLLDQANYG